MWRGVEQSGTRSPGVQEDVKAKEGHLGRDLAPTEVGGKVLIGSYKTRISALMKEGFQEWDEKHICVGEVAGLSEVLG